MSVYGPEFRAAVVADYLSGMSCDEVSSKRGVGATSVSTWVRDAGHSLRPKSTNSESRSLNRTCEVDDCDRPHVARGYCRTHYNRNARGYLPRGQRSPEIHTEDVEWMAESGEHWDNAIKRLGVKDNTLQKHLERANRYDLIRKLKNRVAA